MKVDREARRLAGYRYGRQIADDFPTQLGQGEEQVARWLEAENDPRLNEIVSHLNHVVEEGAYPMSEKVVFSQLSRKFIDENDATPRRGAAGGLLQPGDWSPPWGYRLPGSGSPARGMNIWHGLPLWRQAAKPAEKWKACRNMVDRHRH